MKLRNGFVSNSSSTSFIITNKTDHNLKLVDFVKENPQLVDKFKKNYGYTKNEVFCQDNMIKDALVRDELFKPGDNYATYGDNDYDTLGTVFDYILRDGGSSESFEWCFEEYNR
jgi:hypothetical protein